VERSGDYLTVRDYLGGETRVTLTPSTQIQERKKNPFRKSNRYSPNQLLLGLNIDVKGRGDRNGTLVAEKIKFTQDNLQVAETITSRVAPVESELGKTRMSLESTQAQLADTEKHLEETTQRVDGQLEELDAAYRTARSEAHGAQDTANKALGGVEAANQRISSLDDYDVVKTVTVQFAFDSSNLPENAKPEIDELAQQYRSQKGYLIEVVGYASSDGDLEYNRRLSQKRADSAVRYLTEKHAVPLRRIITPYGFGENSPIADNSTVDGRKRNRRVEVRILVSRGLDQPGTGDSSGIAVEDIR
jgi:outer membrane protein OmpA-like peptidoglycan-associated protein